MDRRLIEALRAGSQRVAAWADLLDGINVFPVADADTGRNLTLSLAPFDQVGGSTDDWSRHLMTAATGNSGNIAAAFLIPFVSRAVGGTLHRAVSAGRDAAWKAVADPRPGTMLTVFDSLEQTLRGRPVCPDRAAVDRLVASLEASVRSTLALLPELKPAGVVDAGALGMFIFFEGLFRRLQGDDVQLPSVTRRFEGLLRLNGTMDPAGGRGYCVNTVFTPPADSDVSAMAARLGESVVAVSDGDRLKLHLHTPDQQDTRSKLEEWGTIVDWQAESLTCIDPVSMNPENAGSVHLMTDAAGSLTRPEARRLGVTLLDSYLIVDRRRVSETLFDHRKLYQAMAAGDRVSTAQASLFQRHQSYESVLGRFDRVLYLAVGSAYTGNFTAASRWRDANGCADRFSVVDTGAASGRLGLIVRMTAGFAAAGNGLAAVSSYAGEAIARCEELVFLDQLKFLAAGGRISKAKGFWGDLLGIKPVISPASGGAVKVGTVRSETDQVAFALNHLFHRFPNGGRLTCLLQFSDNEKRVRESIQPAIARQFPQSRILVRPLSLTSGAHMGPGTWALAFCPNLSAACP